MKLYKDYLEVFIKYEVMKEHGIGLRRNLLLDSYGRRLHGGRDDDRCIDPDAYDSDGKAGEELKVIVSFDQKDTEEETLEEICRSGGPDADDLAAALP